VVYSGAAAPRSLPSLPTARPLELLLLFIPGIILLLLGAEVLVRGAVDLAVAWGISPLVVGLTIVAFGTSAPEAAVSIQSALAGGGDIALGNVVGSNIMNVLFILGASALVAPLIVSRQLLRLDLPVMIGASLLPLGMGLNGRIDRWEGVILVAGVLLYTAFLVRLSRRNRLEGAAQIATEEVPEQAQRGALLNLLLIVAGGAMLALGSRWLVDGAVQLATLFGVSQLLIGLTVVAGGTSLPEVATSILASARGQRDIAVGNVVGSNTFNLLLVLGASGVVATDGVPIIPAALTFDVPIMIAVALACYPIFLTGLMISRWEGALLLSFYVAYIVFLVLDATGHAALPLFRQGMTFLVLPATAVGLTAFMVRELWKRPAGRL